MNEFKPPAPKNKSLAPPDPGDKFVLTPQKIEKVLSRFTPLKMESSPQRTTQRPMSSKPTPQNPIHEDENQRPPWNSDVQVQTKHSPSTPFTKNVFREVNQLRGTKSFMGRLKESQENNAVYELSDQMEKLSTQVRGKDEEIKILEGKLGQAKKEINQLKLAANSRQVEWVESLRSEAEVRNRMEVELSQIKAKMELDKRNLINEQAQVERLKNEMAIALSVMDDGQREKFKSKIPQA